MYTARNSSKRKRDPEVSLNLLRENDVEIFFDAGTRFAWIGAVVFGAASGLVVARSPLNDPLTWCIAAAPAVLAGGLAILAFRRDELTLNLLTRTYTRRVGYWPSPKCENGSFSDLAGVVLSTREGVVGPADSERVGQVWTVSLAFIGEKEPSSICISEDHDVAYQEFKRLSKKIGIPAINRTRGAEVITLPKDLV